MINSARKQGMCAAYLSVAAIVVAFVIAILVTGVTVGVIRPNQYRYYYLFYWTEIFIMSASPVF